MDTERLKKLAGILTEGKSSSSKKIYALFTDKPYESNFSDGKISACGPFSTRAEASKFENVADDEVSDMFRGFIFELNGSGKFVGVVLSGSNDKPIKAVGPFSTHAEAKKAAEAVADDYEVVVASVMSPADVSKKLKTMNEAVNRSKKVAFKKLAQKVRGKGAEELEEMIKAVYDAGLNDGLLEGQLNENVKNLGRASSGNDRHSIVSSALKNVSLYDAVIISDEVDSRIGDVYCKVAKETLEKKGFKLIGKSMMARGVEEWGVLADVERMLEYKDITYGALFIKKDTKPSDLTVKSKFALYSIGGD